MHLPRLVRHVAPSELTARKLLIAYILPGSPDNL